MCPLKRDVFYLPISINSPHFVTGSYYNICVINHRNFDIRSTQTIPVFIPHGAGRMP
eukprot:SAG31_NODE_12485_length_938_cov_1.106079_1_plen_56_part_10